MANPEHVAVVREGTAALKLWYRENPGQQLDLSDSNFTEIISLPGEKYANLDLVRADLRRVDFTFCHLNGINMRGADLRGANLNLCVFQGVGLSGASLDGATLHSATLIACDLSEAWLIGTDLHHASIEQCRFTGSNLTGAKLEYVTVKASDFRGACLFGAFAPYLTLKSSCPHESSDFSGVDFEEVILIGSTLHPDQWMADVLPGWDLLAQTGHHPKIDDFQTFTHKKIVDRLIHGEEPCVNLPVALPRESVTHLRFEPRGKFEAAWRSFAISPQQILQELWIRRRDDLERLGYTKCPQVIIDHDSAKIENSDKTASA